MSLPQLPREPIRPERERPEADQEIWQPHWRCFCCQDAGAVSLVLTRLVIPDYDIHRDRRVACQHPRCEAGKHFRGDPNYDQRFTAGICSELDAKSREDWRQTAKAKFESKRNVNEDIRTLVNGMRMPGVCDRTANDELEIQQRQQEIAAVSQEKWLAMANEYLGEEALAQLGGDKL